MSISVFQKSVPNHGAASHVYDKGFWSLLKTSSNHNMIECPSACSPFVGYSNLPYSKAIFTNLAAIRVKIGSMINKSDEIMPLTAEITHKLLAVKEDLQRGFCFVTERRMYRIVPLLLPAKKILFDILKNLVTFTASNHCMYGGKRYN